MTVQLVEQHGYRVLVRVAQSCCWFRVGGVPVVALMVRSVVVLLLDHVVALMVHSVLLTRCVCYACLWCWLVLLCWGPTPPCNHGSVQVGVAR